MSKAPQDLHPSRSGDRLTQALVALAAQGGRPRCGDPETAVLWTSDDQHDRTLAAAGCTGCPVLDECLAAGEGEVHGVWGGVDRGRSSRQLRG